MFRTTTVERPPRYRLQLTPLPVLRSFDLGRYLQPSPSPCPSPPPSLPLPPSPSRSTRMSQAVASSALHAHDVDMWVVRGAPAPFEVVWRNLGMGVQERDTRRLLL